MARLLTVNEVGEMLGITTKDVYQMVYKRKLSYVKMGTCRSSRLRFRQDDIERYINDCLYEAI